MEEDQVYDVVEMDFHQGYSRPRIKLEDEEAFLDTLEVPEHIAALLAQIRKQVIESLERKPA